MAKKLIQQKLLSVKPQNKHESNLTAPESGCASGGNDTPSLSSAKVEPKINTSITDSDKDNSAAMENVITDLKKKSQQNIIEIVSAFESYLKVRIQNKSQLGDEYLSSKRRKTPRIDMFFKYGKEAEESSSDGYSPEKLRKRSQKATRKKGPEKTSTTLNKMLNEDGKRKVPDGVSIFDLIMPWKNDIKQQKPSEAINASKVLKTKTKV